MTKWTTIPDTFVMHIWRDTAGAEHEIPPTFYEEMGTPSDEDGDMTYVRTEIKYPTLTGMFPYTVILATEELCGGAFHVEAVDAEEAGQTALAEWAEMQPHTSNNPDAAVWVVATFDGHISEVE